MLASHTPQRIVVIDNDPDALELAVLDLSLEGHDIVGQGLDGATALELVRAKKPDVLVVDHRMPPGPWGLDVATTVRTEWPAVRIVIYSNYQSFELIEATKALGAAFVPKGNLRTLRRAVRPPTS